MSAFFFVLVGGGWHWGVDLAPGDPLYRQATTACLTAIVVMQIVNVHLCRSRRRSLVSRPLFANAVITAGIAAEVALILLIDYTAPAHAVFGTAAIGYEAWLIVLPFCGRNAGTRGDPQGTRPLAGGATRGRHPGRQDRRPAPLHQRASTRVS